jgi:succinate dehydrogenase hydrophobic anchor subunit
VCVTVCAVLVLQLLVQPSMHSWAHWSKLALEVLVVAGLLITYGTGDHVRNWHQHTYSKPVWRATTVLIILASATNAGSGLLLVQEILGDSASFDTFDLLLSAGTIYVTNIVVFGLWYWHCDRGGQGRRFREGAFRASVVAICVGRAQPAHQLLPLPVPAAANSANHRGGNGHGCRSPGCCLRQAGSPQCSVAWHDGSGGGRHPWQ